MSRHVRPDALPPSILLREVDRNPRHVRIAVHVGRNGTSRPLVGSLTLDVDEWDELSEAIDAAEADGTALYVDDVLETRRLEDDLNDAPTDTDGCLCVAVARDGRPLTNPYCPTHGDRRAEQETASA